jgi:hypothetical protein
MNKRFVLQLLVVLLVIFALAVGSQAEFILPVP